MGNPPRESLVVAIQEVIQDPRQLQKLERKVDHLTAEKRNTTERDPPPLGGPWQGSVLSSRPHVNYPGFPSQLGWHRELLPQWWKPAGL